MHGGAHTPSPSTHQIIVRRGGTPTSQSSQSSQGHHNITPAPPAPSHSPGGTAEEEEARTPAYVREAYHLGATFLDPWLLDKTIASEAARHEAAGSLERARQTAAYRGQRNDAIGGNRYEPSAHCIEATVGPDVDIFGFEFNMIFHGPAAAFELFIRNTLSLPSTVR